MGNWEIGKLKNREIRNGKSEIENRKWNCNLFKELYTIKLKYFTICRYFIVVSTRS